MASFQPGNKLIPFIRACGSINHRDTSAPESRAISHSLSMFPDPARPLEGPVTGRRGWSCLSHPEGPPTLQLYLGAAVSDPAACLCLQAVQSL